jgi:hypothetical protein
VAVPAGFEPRPLFGSHGIGCGDEELLQPPSEVASGGRGWWEAAR